MEADEASDWEWLMRHDPVIREVVDAAGVYPPGHFDEDPRRITWQ